jgi:hypothetical protein
MKKSTYSVLAGTIVAIIVGGLLNAAFHNIWFNLLGILLGVTVGFLLYIFT